MKEQYRTIKFNAKNSLLLEETKTILEEYEEQSIRVTLRQLYYQLVSRDIIPNRVEEYRKLCGLLTKARYAGEIDWEAIEDRTRVPDVPQTFNNVKDFMEAVLNSYKLDKWADQDYYVELWTEKDALSSIVEPLTRKWEVPFCVNRGYSSASAMYGAKERFFDKIVGNTDRGIILYLGDHDPSGLDMIRDIGERMIEFNADAMVIQIALTKEQIDKYNPPPNPAKITDPRAKWYIENYGNVSWEVDALRPDVLRDLIDANIKQYLDLKKFKEVQKKEKEEMRQVEEFVDTLD